MNSTSSTSRASSFVLYQAGDYATTLLEMVKELGVMAIRPGLIWNWRFWNYTRSCLSR